MPYLFEPGADPALLAMTPAQILLGFDLEPSLAPLSHFEYYRLCVASHFLTCATPVPTDVDIQIRQKLWAQGLPLETVIEMASLVLAARKWDFTQVSRRFTRGAAQTDWEQEVLSGHLGEWFTIAAGAYCALKKYAAPEAAKIRQEIFEAILDEIHRHSEIFGTHWRSENGIQSLKTAANISHNFGDLDRVMDMWGLGLEDPLRLKYYKLTQTPFDPEGKLRYLGRLWVAGELYKEVIAGSSLAFENHRHFALRKPKCLRKSPKLLIQFGPFLEDWGKAVAEFNLANEELVEVVEALVHGWSRLPNTVGYGRALRGIFNVKPNLREHFEASSHLFKNHRLRSTLELSQERFESKWNAEAIKLMDEIPSRAG